MPIPIGMLGGLGLPGILLLVALLVFTQVCSRGGGGGGFGVDSPLDGFPSAGVAPGEGGGVAPEDDPDVDLVNFVSAVLDDVQIFWIEEFSRAGQQYREAQLVLFEDSINTGCGFASSAVGPFYCGADETVYLDLGFFRELHARFGAPGDFAQAYVIGHEIAHHIQNITGISQEVRDLSAEDPDDANELSVRQELQADCLAGVWGYSTQQRGILEAGDLNEAIEAAAAIGDDRIQQQSTGRTNPESWTHGSSEQRVEWFRRGFESGDASNCNTFESGI